MGHVINPGARNFIQFGAGALAEQYPKIDAFCSRFEKTLNFAGYLPIINIGSALTRAAFGAVEVIAGLAYAIIQGIRSCCAAAPQKAQLKAEANNGLIYILHGLGNITRAILEEFYGIGTIANIAYDKGLMVRVRYQTEN